MPQNWNDARPATITNIDLNNGICDIEWLDVMGGARKNVSLTPVYAGRGWGVLTGIEERSAVLAVSNDNGVNILCYLYQNTFFHDDLSNVINATHDEFPYTQILEGEIALQSKANSLVYLNDTGDIRLETADGTFFELNREIDQITALASQFSLTTEAARVTSGLVRRDIRTEEEKENSILFSGTSGLNFELEDYKIYIGSNPAAAISTGQQGVLDLEAGSEGTFNNITQFKNPGLTEHKIEFTEFGDSNVGNDFSTQGATPEEQDELKALGKLPSNILGNLVFGTVVNKIGKTTRFDYGFGTGSNGHGAIWSVPALNNAAEEGRSVDFLFDKKNTLSSPKGITSRDSAEWTVNENEDVNFATLLQVRLHTKGVDNEGLKEDDSFRGSDWEFQIDKEGLTKINLPAATSGVNNSPFRAGRSLLFNSEGSATLAFGREKATAEQGLDSITGSTPDTAFLTRNRSPDYGRKDRSLTADFQGNIELLVGGDSNVNQSVILEAGGSFTFYFGKEHTAEDSTSVVDEAITTASKAGTRNDRSITGKTTGSVELLLGKEDELGQSLALETEGGILWELGSDNNDFSFEINSRSNIVFTTDSGKVLSINEVDNELRLEHSDGGYLVIESGGEITTHHPSGSSVKLDNSGDVIAESSIGASLTLTSTGDIDVRTTTGNVNINALGSANVTAPEIRLTGANIGMGVDGGVAGGAIVTTLTWPVDLATGIPFMGTVTNRSSGPPGQ